MTVGAVYDRAIVAFDGKNCAVIDRAYSQKFSRNCAWNWRVPLLPFVKYPKSPLALLIEIAGAMGSGLGWFNTFVASIRI